MRRLYLLLFAVAAGIACGWWLNHRPAPASAPQAAVPGQKHLSPPTPEPVLPPPPTAEPVVFTPAPMPPPPPIVVPVAPPQVRIQDGKTIDFSSGKPVVKESGEEKAIIDAAVKEMDAAAKDVRFGSTGPATEEKKMPATR